MRHLEEGWEFFEVHLRTVLGNVTLNYAIPESLHEVEFGSVFHRTNTGGLNGAGARVPLLQLFSKTGEVMAIYPSPGSANAPQVLFTTWGVADSNLFVPLPLDRRDAVMSFGALIRPGDRFSIVLDNGTIDDTHTAQVRYRGR